MRFLSSCFGLVLLAACSSTPSFDDRIQRREDECTVDGVLPCMDDQVCLSGRCFERCVGDDECSSRERCEMGVCVATGRETDAGTFDAGNQRPPCGGMCEGDTPFCDIRNDECVQCVDEGDCPDGELCDYARGACITEVASRRTICAPCDSDAQCFSGEGCVLDDDRNERVCLARCDDEGMCPSGFRCDGDGSTDSCRPTFGGCTELERATTLTTCESAADCVPRGEMGIDALCANVALPPDGLMMGNLCQVACDVDVGCPDFPGIPDGALVNCAGEMDNTFCVVTYP